MTGHRRQHLCHERVIAPAIGDWWANTRCEWIRLRTFDATVPRVSSGPARNVGVHPISRRPLRMRERPPYARLMPALRMRDSRVVGLRPRRWAAPPSPRIRQRTSSIVLPCACANSRTKVTHQERDILGARPQRRHYDREGVQPVVEATSLALVAAFVRLDHLFHHAVEVEAAGLLARREVAEALQP